MKFQGLCSEQSPRAVALRVMEFSPSLDNVVVTPKDPTQDTTVVIEHIGPTVEKEMVR
ncbi:MAG: hypothetical protein Ct9H90mP23_0040 [Methanobacteriota archaeon]|nr:MAG: hypothetical protein Ct9H90mP23_0040 [Euryarchaeota archaeon]